MKLLCHPKTVDAKHVFHIGLFTTQLLLFCGFWYYFRYHAKLLCACQILPNSFPLAKTSAALIGFNTCLVLLSSIKFPRRYFYIPIAPAFFHLAFVFYVYCWSIIHTAAHYVNFAKLQVLPFYYFSWGVGFTGHLLWILLLLFGLSSSIKHTWFHKFSVTHNLLLLLYYTFSIVHGCFCFFQNDHGACNLPTAWIWLTPPILLFAIEVVYHYSQQPVQILNVVYYPDSTTIELRLSLPEYYAGKTVWICCPEVSVFEWHPFTTSTHDSSTLTTSLHIKLRGNWTEKFAKALGITGNALFPVVLPKILLFGPFHVTPKNFTKTLENRKCLVVSSGIGITTFVHTLSKIISIQNGLRIVIVTKSPTDVPWILHILQRLYNKQGCHVEFYFTDTAIQFINNFPLPYQLGRPDFQNIVSEFGEGDIFHSGTPQVTRELQTVCKSYKSIRFRHVA